MSKIHTIVKDMIGKNQLIGKGTIKLEAHKCTKCKILTTSHFPGGLCDDCYANKTTS